MKDSFQKTLECEIRELLGVGDFDRKALNDLLRENEEARPLAAKILLEEASLIGCLRMEGVKDWAHSLELKLSGGVDLELLSAAGKQVSAGNARWKKGMGLAIAVSVTVFMGVIAFSFWKESAPEIPRVVVDRSVAESIGSVTATTLKAGPYEVGDRITDGEIHIGEQRLRIDLDNGIALSVTGPARVWIGLDRAYVSEGELHVDAPEHISAYIVETEFGRFVDLGTVFSVSAVPDESIALSASKGPVHAELFSPEEGVTSERTVRAGEAIFARKEDLEFETIAISQLAHQSSLPLLEAPFSFSGSSAYRERVLASKPLILWGFDDTSTPHRIPNQMNANFVAEIAGDVVIQEDTTPLESIPITDSIPR